MDYNEATKEIVQGLEKYLSKFSKYSPKVTELGFDLDYPTVTFKTTKNVLASRTRDRVYQTRNLSFEIEVIAINNESDNSLDICDEITNLTIEYMQEVLGMQGGLDATLTNINADHASKQVLHFSGEWWVNRGVIF